MRDFVTIYEYSFNGSNIRFIFPILLFAAFGFGIVYVVKKYYKNFSVYRQLVLFVGWFLGVIPSIMLVFFLIKIPFILKHESELKEMIENKTYLIVEGEIEHFKPLINNSPNHFESFSINGVYFQYSDYVNIDGFHQTSLNNGPIRENGQFVRIGYITTDNENVILKLELEKQTLKHDN